MGDARERDRMSRSSAKGKRRRLSRSRIPRRGDLRGLSARDYYAQEEMTRGILGKLRPLVEPGLWKKLDRGKPISGEQAEEIGRALGSIAVRSKCWPFSWPVVRMTPKGVGAKRPAAEFRHVRVEGMPKVATADGNVFVPTQQKVEADGRSGTVGFSSHAIEQWLARTNYSARHIAMRLGEPGLAMKFLASVVRGGAVECGQHGPCLAIMTTCGETKALGYFPLVPTSVGGQDAWVCKTYLHPGMRGVPGELPGDCDPIGGPPTREMVARMDALMDELGL